MCVYMNSEHFFKFKWMAWFGNQFKRLLQAIAIATNNLRRWKSFLSELNLIDSLGIICHRHFHQNSLMNTHRRTVAHFSRNEAKFVWEIDFKWCYETNKMRAKCCHFRRKVTKNWNECNSFSTIMQNKRVVYFIAESGKVHKCETFANNSRTIRNGRKRTEHNIQKSNAK